MLSLKKYFQCRTLYKEICKAFQLKLNLNFFSILTQLFFELYHRLYYHIKMAYLNTVINAKIDFN